MKRKFDNDPKMIESKINLVKAIISQAKNSIYLTGQERENSIKKWEAELLILTDQIEVTSQTIK